MPSAQKLAVILFADIAGYTALMQQDQEMALQLLNRFKLVLEAETAQNNGEVIQYLGDVLFKEGNLFGDGVNVASRIESISVPGAVLMSRSIRNQLKNKPGFQLASMGQFEFKHVEEPIEVFALANEGFVVPNRGEIKGKLKPTEIKSTPSKKS